MRTSLVRTLLYLRASRLISVVESMASYDVFYIFEPLFSLGESFMQRLGFKRMYLATLLFAAAPVCAD